MQLFRHVYGRVVAVPPQEYLSQFRDEDREVYALPLNLTPQQKRELWRALDTRIVAAPEKFNIRTRHCTSVLLEAINDAVRPGHIEVVGSDVIGDADMNVIDAITPEDAPWRNLALRIAMGNVCDRAGTLLSQSAPMVVLQEWRHYRIIYPDGTSVALFSGEPELVIAGNPEHGRPFVTPMFVAVVLLAASAVACVLQWRGRGRRVVRAVDILLFVLVTVGGILLVIALSTPARIGGFANWNLILFNPLLIPAMFLLRRHKTAYWRFCAAYAGLLVVYAVAGPLLTFSIVPSLSLLALAVAARLMGNGVRLKD